MKGSADMLITDALIQNAKRYPDDVALIERVPEKKIRRELSWSAFEKETNQISQFLRGQHIKKNDRVAILMTNRLEWLPIYFGILRCGAVVVPLNFRFEGLTIQKCLALTEAKMIFFEPTFNGILTKIKPELPLLHTWVMVSANEEGDIRPSFAMSYSKVISQMSGDSLNVKLVSSEIAGIYFTSGTTAFPKGVVLTHGNLASAAQVEIEHHHQTKNDVFLCIPPLYHTGAKMHWFGSLLSGSRAVILRGVEAQMILETVSEENVSIVWLLVPWAMDVLFAIESGDLKLSDYRIDQWRLMHIGAQPVPPALVKKWLEVFPHHQYDTNYGLTESSGPGCVHLGVENPHKVGAIGKPGKGWKTRIIDPNGQLVSIGEPGELLVKGPGVMQEYFQNPSETELVLKEGWLYTGDVAKMDKDGFIWLVDRQKDVIITGGENIYPVEVEDFLRLHPAVLDVAVIGVPSTRLGEITLAVIQPKPNCKVIVSELEQHAKGLPRYKRPRQYVLGDVPRNPTGKIEKPKLRKKYSGVEKSFRSEINE